MCGRYTQSADPRKIAQEFGVPVSEIPPLKPKYNIAPTQQVPALVYQEHVKFDFLRWGLIPSWAQDATIGNRMINARKETLAEKPSYRGPFRNQRCLIIADGFYEWKQEGNRKTPYFVRLISAMPFGFAGLWSKWMDPEGIEVRSCAIITGEPNDLLGSIHHRMPVILGRKNREQWLDPCNQDPKKLLSVLEPYPANEMEAYPVSTLVNAPEYDTIECTKKAKPSHDT